ncbi:3-dehydroquinate synthase [bacterium BMS3Bbin03]|nr:3-dehydroquinate synthase [bacterium BMS3Bbin03]
MKTPRKKILLNGMMGSGKSTVGRLLKEVLGWRFVDTDAEIEKRAGKPISRIFAEEGEPAFRKLELKEARRLAGCFNCVVATGGGMFTQPEALQVLAENSLVVHLAARPETLARRLAAAEDRPLLENVQKRERLEEIYKKRQKIYESLPVQIDTENRSPEQVVQAILRRFFSGQEPELIFDRLGEVYSGLNSFEHLPVLIRKMTPVRKIAVLADDVLWPLVKKDFERLFEEEWERLPLVIPAGEGYKSPEQAESLWTQLKDFGADRYTPFIAIGGGVVGDLGGFVAATYMRGIPLIQIPTTLLGQVDSGLGGKTAINYQGVKNLIGSFYHAALTLLDPLFLLTLPKAEVQSGLSEMLKAGILAEPELVDFMEANASELQQGHLPALEWAVGRAARVKLQIVAEDPRERKGKRIFLNLGHTFAHAIESVSAYGIRHGEAVAIGLILAAKLGESLGKTEPGLSQKLQAILLRLGLPTEPPAGKTEEMLQVMQSDKKKKGKRIQFVIPVKIGEPRVVELEDLGIVRKILE